MEPLPLIIAGDHDPHVDVVVRRLRERGVVPVVINKARLCESSLHYDAGRRALFGHDLSRVTSIWHRRAFPVVTPASMERRWRNWCEQEYSQAIYGLLYSLGAFWFNDPFNARRASLKPLQLCLARALAGFSVPPYVVTSDPTVAATFVHSQVSCGSVTKPLGRPVVGDDDQLSTVFTEDIPVADKEYFEGIEFAPCIFQGKVPRRAEIRATVVEEAVFVARIIAETSTGIPTDYRKVDPYALQHQVVSPSREFADGCLRLTHAMGLSYAALDFIETPDGELFFLEINPQGQWLWIEEITGLDISGKIAEVLADTGRLTRRWTE